jgi:Uma2 family endonuclease
MSAHPAAFLLAQLDEDSDDRGVFLRRWTRAEYHRAGELGLFGPQERVELVGGKVFQKVTQRPPHATSVNKTVRTLERVFGPGFVVRGQSPLVLADDSEPEPDAAVVRGGPDDYAGEHPHAPDVLLVVEVSDTTLGYDRGAKSALYAEARITDYWVLNLTRRQLEVRRDPLPVSPGDRFSFGYRTVTIYLETDEVAPLASPDRPVRVADLLPPPPRNEDPS